MDVASKSVEGSRLGNNEVRGEGEVWGALGGYVKVIGLEGMVMVGDTEGVDVQFGIRDED